MIVRVVSRIVLILVSLLIAAILSMLLLAAPIDDALTVSSAQIAYVEAGEHNHRTLYLLQVDRELRVPLAHFNDTLVSSPLAWSPDGSHLAFWRYAPGTPTLFVLNLESMRMTRLTTPVNFLMAGFVSLPLAWSPDSTRLAYLMAGQEAAAYLKMLDTRDGSIRTLAADVNPQALLTWSQDGMTVNRLLPLTAGSLSVGQPGMRTTSILSAHIQADATVTVTDTLVAPACMGVFMAAWSPEGERLVCLVGPVENARGRSDLFLYTPMMGADVLTGRAITLVAGRPESVVWSPDGAALAFHSRRDNNTDIYVLTVGATANSEVAITHDAQADINPAWSPDSTQIAFVTSRHANNDIYVYDFVTDAEHPLVTHPANDAAPVWSPDGAYIAFVSNRDASMGGRRANGNDLYIVPHSGGDSWRVSTITDTSLLGYMPAWRP